MTMVEAVVAHPDPRVAGIGIDYREPDGPPEMFADAYALARRHGLRTTAHAGEFGMPWTNVATVVDQIGVDRVDHGYTIIENPELARACAARGLLFTIVPTNSYYLRTLDADRWALDHPIRRMAQLGLKLHPNTDDPTLHHVSPAGAWELMYSHLGFGLTDLRTMMLNGIDGAWASEAQRRSGGHSGPPNSTRSRPRQGLLRGMAVASRFLISRTRIPQGQGPLHPMSFGGISSLPDPARGRLCRCRGFGPARAVLDRLGLDPVHLDRGGGCSGGVPVAPSRSIIASLTEPGGLRPRRPWPRLCPPGFPARGTRPEAPARLPPASDVPSSSCLSRWRRAGHFKLGKERGEARQQGLVPLRAAHLPAQRGEAGDAEFLDAAGHDPPKCERSGERLTEKPCIVTQRRMRTPMAPILASRPSGPAHQMPMRPSARQASTPKSPSVSITQPSTAWTKPRTSRARLRKSSRT
jgi:hypothetical protein